MKKLILLVLIGLAGWQIYAKQRTPVITNADLRLLNEPTQSTLLSSPSYTQNYPAMAGNIVVK